MKSKTILIGAVAIAVFGIATYRFLPSTGIGTMEGMDHSIMTSNDAVPSTRAFEGAKSTMMTGMMVPPTGKPDLDFMQSMIPHHQGAIDMSKVVLKFGNDAEIKTLAETVVKAQDGEVALIKVWLEKTDKATLVELPDSAKANDATMASMMKNMAASYSGDPDVDYAKGMISHHQGAIDMAKVALQYAKDPEALKLAADVIKAQEGEISFMQDWLKRMGK